MTRLGWSGGIPGNPSGPEQVAEALRQRVAAFYTTDKCRIKLANNADTGTLDLYARNRVSWETEYWSGVKTAGSTPSMPRANPCRAMNLWGMRSA